jgi:flagellar basal-body rod protein FlgG
LKERKFFPYVRGRSTIGTISMTNVLTETTMSTDRGPVQVTDNPTDVLLPGVGFFVVEDGNGNTFYTRSGHFQRDATGTLMTHDGEFVRGDGGRITLGEASRVSIGDNGQVYADGELVGTLQVMNFENPTYLHQAGKSLLAETPESGAPQAVVDPQIVSGALERSNVHVVLEMVRMIEANRAFEAAGRAVTIQDELSGRLFQSVGRPA